MIDDYVADFSHYGKLNNVNNSETYIQNVNNEFSDFETLIWCFRLLLFS